MKTWKDQINEWLNGKPLSYPVHMKNFQGFYFKTSCCDRYFNNEYKEYFELTDNLPKYHNYERFNEYIINTNNDNAIGFFSKSKNPTYLIIPKPKNSYNYAHLKLFIDNAPKKQQEIFWIYVANSIKLLFKLNPHINLIFISTHGLDVPYLHIRIECFPKHSGEIEKLCNSNLVDRYCIFDVSKIPAAYLDSKFSLQKIYKSNKLLIKGILASTLFAAFISFINKQYIDYKSNRKVSKNEIMLNRLIKLYDSLDINQKKELKNIIKEVILDQTINIFNNLKLPEISKLFDIVNKEFDQKFDVIKSKITKDLISFYVNNYDKLNNSEKNYLKKILLKHGFEFDFNNLKHLTLLQAKSLTNKL